MSTFLVLCDGRAWLTSNGIFDAVIESMVSVLGVENDPDELGKFLLEQRCLVQGPGVGSLDLRHLSPSAVQRVEKALPLAIRRLQQDQSIAEAVRESIDLLERMIVQTNIVHPSVRGGVVEATGERRGPGWEGCS